MSRALVNSTRPDELVYDAFAGSGSTMIAADQTSRRAYLMEIEPRYAQVCIERFERFSGRQAVKVN